MIEFLCLQIGEVALSDSSPVDWTVTTADGRITASGRAELQELAGCLPASEAVRRNLLIVPGSALLLTSVEVVSQQQRHLKQLLPFIVEEQLVEPIESMHLALPPFRSGQRIDVAALRRETLAHWLEQFEAIGILPDYAFADVLCVPQKQGDWQLLLDGDSVLYREALHGGMSLDIETVLPVLDMALAEDEQRQLETGGVERELKVALLSPQQASLPASKERLQQWLKGRALLSQEVDYSESAAELLAVNAVCHVESTLNLLQGDFKAISANADERRFVRRSMLSVAACLALFLSFTLLGGIYLNHRADESFSHSVTLYKSLFPQQRRVIDPVKQMRRKLAGQVVGGVVSDFLPLLDTASQALSRLDEESQVVAQISQLRYDNQRGNITLELRAEHIDQLERYKTLLVEEGLKVEILSASQDKDVVNGRMQIARS